MTRFLLRFLLKLVRFAGIVGFVLVCVYLYNSVREGIFLDETLRSGFCCF